MCERWSGIVEKRIQERERAAWVGRRRKHQNKEQEAWWEEELSSSQAINCARAAVT